jgi:UDP-glucuronate decarboxylase
LPADDPVRRCPDISVARRDLGWEPRVELDDGLLRTIRAFEAEGTASSPPREGERP